MRLKGQPNLLKTVSTKEKVVMQFTGEPGCLITAKQ